MPSYVLPVPKWMRGKLLEYNRLYAYPSIAEPPAPNGFIILDSGAFALSRQKAKRKRDYGYMRNLARFYEATIEKWGTHQVVPVAPDVYLRPDVSMAHWETWHQHGFPNVAPVLQAHKTGDYGFGVFREQAQFYANDRNWNAEYLFVSNPGCRAAACAPKLLKELVEMLREITSARHIHNFGAGWDAADIRGWANMNAFDSIDSIAYYTAKTRFRDSQFDDDKVERATDNARFANLMMGYL